MSLTVPLETYILDENGEPQLEPDLLKWAKWLRNANRILLHTPVTAGVTVITFFLALDPVILSGPPILFETIIYGGHRHLYTVRYSTRADALAGHRMIVSGETMLQMAIPRQLRTHDINLGHGLVEPAGRPEDAPTGKTTAEAPQAPLAGGKREDGA